MEHPLGREPDLRGLHAEVFEEGLEQDFNSLHALRLRPVEAFIKSQTGEGWRLHQDRLTMMATFERDDGTSRPSTPVGRYEAETRRRGGRLQGHDRLTRSLADFAKMVEVFDTRGVSFVAVTQQFQHDHFDGPTHAECPAFVARNSSGK